MEKLDNTIKRKRFVYLKLRALFYSETIYVYKCQYKNAEGIAFLFYAQLTQKLWLAIISTLKRLKVYTQVVENRVNHVIIV